MDDKLMTPNQTAIAQVKTEIETQKDRFEKYPQSGRVIDSYLIYLSLNYDLLKCTPNSLVKCLLEAVILKLDFTKAKGQLCIIAYGQKAELCVEYRGFVDVILRNNKDIAYVDAKAVYLNDCLDTDSAKISHIPCALNTKRGEMIGAYAKAVYKTGGERNILLYSDDIQKIRGCAKQDYVWKKWPGQMAMKSAVRRLCKLFPMSEDLSNIIESLDKNTELPQEPDLDEKMEIKMQEAGLETEDESSGPNNAEIDPKNEVSPEITAMEGKALPETVSCSPDALEKERHDRESQTSFLKEVSNE